MRYARSRAALDTVDDDANALKMLKENHYPLFLHGKTTRAGEEIISGGLQVRVRFAMEGEFITSDDPVIALNPTNNESIEIPNLSQRFWFNVVDRSVDPTPERVTDGAVNDNMVENVASRIADESEIRRSKQFPYQYFAAYLNADDNVPQQIKTALHKAAEIPCGTVPDGSGL